MTHARHSRPLFCRPAAPLSMSVVALLALSIGAPAAAAVLVVEGACTLVDALTAANSNDPVGGCPAGDPGEDTVVLTGDVTLTRVNNNSDGPNGLPVIGTPITIEGAGYSISRDPTAPEFRIFSIGTGGRLRLNNATVANGLLSEDAGAGIRAEGPLTVVNSTIENNVALDRDGGGVDIGCIYGLAITFDQAVIADNRAREGGGVDYNCFLSPNLLTLRDTTVSGNFATEDGGGIHSYGGDVLIEGSTITGNIAQWRGGGLSVKEGNYVLTNSTISGNAAGVRGGGMVVEGYVYTCYGETYVEVTNTTIAENLRHGIYIDEGEVVVANSVLADSCAGDVCGPIDGGGNYSSVGGGCPGDALTGFDAELRDNGGRTMTHALLEGSTAIDSDEGCDLAKDQRGFLREDGSCDSGSYEFDAPAPLGLELRGACPGPIHLSIAGAAPSATVAILFSPNPGRGTIPVGPCAGTELELDDPLLRKTVVTDRGGFAEHDFDLSGERCGDQVQAIDLVTCSVSEAIGFH